MANLDRFLTQRYRKHSLALPRGRKSVHLFRENAPARLHVQMQVAKNDSLDIFNAMACFRDGSIQLMIFGIVDSRKDVTELWPPDFGVVTSSTGLVKKETFGWM